jgi:RNA polymerase sigma-70 factor (ECF subfamily)
VPVSATEVTGLLRRWRAGDCGALDDLIPLVHLELHRLAQGYMGRERRDHTLQTPALVNEAVLRLVEARDAPCQDRAHFLAIAARLMRQVLVDHARARRSRKRGGGLARVALDDSVPAASVDVLALDQAGAPRGARRPDVAGGRTPA